jgi:hypothetical protein
LAGTADGLAGEPAANQIDSWPGISEPPFDAGSDVVMPGHLRPVFRQHPPAERVDLDLPDNGHARPLEAEF